MENTNNLYDKLRVLINDFVDKCYDDSLFISISSIILDYNDFVFTIESYHFEPIDCIDLENNSDKYINGVEYDEIWSWEKVLEELLEKVNFVIPMILKFNPISYGYIVMNTIDEGSKVPSKIEMILEEFMEENVIGYDKNNKDYDKTFIEHGLDSLQLSLLEFKIQENFKESVMSGQMFLLKNNTPNKVIKCLSEGSLSVTDKITNVSKSNNIIIPTWSQKRFLFFRKYSFEYFSKMYEGIKVDLGTDKVFLGQLESRINTILSYINILRTTINDQNTLECLSRTESFISLYQTNEKMKKAITFKDNQIPLKIRTVKKGHSIILTILLHHIVGDGRSFQILLDYLSNYKNNEFEGYNYCDYQKIEEEYYKSEQFNIDKEFFRNSLSNVEITDNEEYLYKDEQIELLSFRIPMKLTDILKRMSMKYNISVFSIFLTIYKIIYYKIHGISNIGIGIPCEHRPNSKFHNTIGLFINVLPFFCEIDSNLKIVDIMIKNYLILREYLCHKQFPYDEITLLSKEKRTNLFDVMFIQDQSKVSSSNYKVKKLKSSYLECKEVWTFTQEEFFFNVNVKFDKNIINESQMKTWISGFLLVIEGLFDSFNVPLNNYNIYKNLSVEKVLKKKNFIQNPDLYNVFKKQIDLKDSQIREEKNEKIYWLKNIVDESIQLSFLIEEYYFSVYGEISIPDKPVIVHFERNINLIKVILALSFSSFATFLINPEDTPQQYHQIGEVLYINETILNDINQFRINIHRLRRNCRKITDIFYLTSTSGSSGKPKIVCSELKGLLNLITVYTKKFFISCNSNIYQVVNHSFDIFFIDIFQGFFNGSNIILSKSKIPNLENFSKYKISHAYIMPAYLEKLDINKTKLLSNVEVFLYGGESLKNEILNNLYNVSNEFKIYQEYGLTEHSIYTNIKNMRRECDSKEIGISIQNTGCGIVDSDRKFILPCNSGGKYFVTFGEGVSRGYINNKEVKNSFIYLEEYMRCLMTGDIVSYNKRLRNFIYKQKYQKHLSGSTLYSKYIPMNWIPQYFIHHEDFPLNANGKVDKNLLNQINPLKGDDEEFFETSNVYLENKDEILDIFNYYLPGSNIIVNDNIFDKGANSITLMMIVQDLENKCKIDVSLKDLFKYKTLTQLYENGCIHFSKKKFDESSILQHEVFQNVPLTYGQKYMWFANEFSRENDEYIIKWKLKFNKELQISRIKYIVQNLMKLNITLRTVFVKEKFTLTQQALSMTECFLNYQYNQEQVNILFNLSEDIPIKVNINSNDQLWITFHHICVDGFSFTIIKDQMIELFKNKSNFLKTNTSVSYYDYALEYNKKWKDCLENLKPIKEVNYGKKFINNFETFININFKNIDASSHFSILLYSFGKSLKAYYDNKIIINIPIMNRPNKYLKTVGFFVETFPFLFTLKEGNDMKMLTSINEQLTGILSKEVPPYGIEVNKLLDNQINPQKYSFMLILDSFNLKNDIQMNNELSVEIVEEKSIIGKFDQTWTVNIIEDKVKIKIEYNRDYFSLEEIKKQVGKFQSILKVLINTNLRNKILELTKECLKIDNEIDTTKSFFELGGNSISGALLCSTIRYELKIPAKVQTLFENPIIESFIKNTMSQQLVESTKEDVSVMTMYTNYNNIEINPFVLQIIKYMEKNIKRPKMNKKYGNYIKIKVELSNSESLTYNINFLLKIQPNLRSIVYLSDGHYYCRFLSLTESFLFVNNTSGFNRDFFNYSYHDLFVKPWFCVFFDVIESSLHLNIGHTIVDGSSMKILNEIIKSDVYEISGNLNIYERTNTISTFKSIYYENSANNELKEYLDNCKETLKHQGNKLQQINYTNKFSTCILNLKKYTSIIKMISFKNNVTPFAYLLTIISRSLSEALKVNSICVNIPFDVRNKNINLKNIIGMYVNVMPFLIRITDDVSVLESTQKTITKLLDYCDICTYNYLNENIPIMITNEYIEETNNNIFNKIQHDTKNNLSIFIVTGEEVKIIIYRRKGFMEDSIFNRFLEIVYNEVIKAFISHSKKCNEAKNIPTNETLLSLLIKQSLLTPNNISIKTETINFTYNDMLKKIIQRSFIIKEDYFKEIGETLIPETVVPIEVNKEINDIFNILAILYSGGSYNPIDYELPQKRKEKYINQSNGLFFIKKNTYSLNSFNNYYNKYFNRCIGTNLAYVIYTSGTTGQPKGICINQDSVINMIVQSTKNFFLSTYSTIYQFTRLCFDNSILEIFGNLCNGGIIYQSQLQYFDSYNFKNDILKYNITHAMLFPGLVNSFNIEEKKEMSLLKYWIVGAEKLPKKLFNEMIQNNVLIIQNYGPTEITGYCLFKVMRKNDNPQNIGKPIENMSIKIVQEKSASSYGELLISGVGITRGFLNNKHNLKYFYGIWYRTGDIVDLTKSGDIIFIGRNDNQIKIRGFRVELSDIESTIDQLDGVKCSRVIFNEGKLYAIYVSNNYANTIDEEIVKNYCIDNLPNYAIPNKFKNVKEIFLTKNMKIDRDKVLSLFTKNSNYEIELNKELTTILEIWKRNLNNPNITIKDKFFEIGGNSINSIQIMHEINNIFDPHIYVTDIYYHETIYDLVKTIKFKFKKLNKQNTSSLHHNTPPANFNPNNIQLSFQQYQMYFLNQTLQYRHTNIIFTEEINISFDKKTHLQKIFMKLIANNIMLRTIYIEDKHSSTIIQRALSLTECFFYFQIKSFDNIKLIKEDIQKNYNTKFNLSSEIPIKPYVYLFKLKLIAVLIMNHIITDAWSTKIVNSYINQYLSIDEEKLWISSSNNKDIYSYVSYCYNQLSKYTIYNNLADEYSLYLTSNKMYDSFFNVKIKQNILTTSYYQQNNKCYTKKYILTKEESSQLLILASSYQVSPFVIFLSIFLYHIYKCKVIFQLTNCEDELLSPNNINNTINKQTISILFPFFNRPLFDEDKFSTIHKIPQTIGLFLNNLFLNINLDVSQELTIKDIIQLTKQSVDKCMEYKEIPWPFLKSKLRSRSSSSYLYDIYFNCRYDMEYSNGRERSQLIEELENIDNDKILDPIQCNIDKINDYFVFEYKIHSYLINENKVPKIFEDFEKTTRNFLENNNNYIEYKDKKKNILDIIKEVLEIPITSQINYNDNFYEIGGNSLSFIKLAHLLRENLKINISMDEFLSCETIDDIISLTKKNKQKNVEKIRIILFPGLFGSTHPYKNLINHFKTYFDNIDIISIIYPKYINNFKDFPSFIEYIKITFEEKYYPLTDIPTLLIGTSFGGIVAYEFYQSISCINNKYIINIDGIADNRHNKTFTFQEHSKLFLKYINKNCILSDGTSEKYPDITSAIKHSWNLLQLVINYLPTKNFNIKILLFTSITNQNPYLWWDLFTNVTTFSINSSHDEILNNDNSKEIARYIKDFLS
uniref:Carrier domain-containing protein n=1 Tax=Strongyloides stercoralis TaxID=6248 RepID=A0A0K0E4P1_STRER